jgi:polysaccharide pyruvyl transferase WcaK-like protein
MHIALFNVHYSENLGDGLLSLCLARQIVKANPDVTVSVYDLAGRTGYGEGSWRRDLASQILDKTPGPLRNVGMQLTLGRVVKRQLRPLWAEALSKADCAVLGGGNLLIDINLNFPLKLSGLGTEIARSRTPWALFGVGASDHWSLTARRLFESAVLGSLPQHVALRDERSKKIWDSAFVAKGAIEAEVCHDPAVLTCDHFPAVSSAKSGPPILGLNITAPEEIKRHSQGHSMPGHALTEWWSDLVRRALDAGYEIRAFGNGGEQDDRYLKSLNAHLGALGVTRNARLSFMPRPLVPQTLAATIAGCDVIAGHRLHAHIPAFSYQIPSVGFGWDVKLRSFFESVGRGEFMVDTGESTPLSTLERIALAKSTGIEKHTWFWATSAARRNVARLVDSLAAAMITCDLRSKRTKVGA